MTWMKVDDRLHSHAKTRRALKSNPEKMRDAAAMGLWACAGSWAGQNETGGWVPADELDRFDDEHEALAKRLVLAGFWWPEQRNGEDGYRFNDWHDWNLSHTASQDGSYGNHVKWHINRKVVSPDCDFCPREPDEPDEPESPPTRGDIAPESHPMSPPESGHPIGANRVPDPTRPDQKDLRTADAARDRSDEHPRFAEFWKVYDKTGDRKRASDKFKLAIKRKGVTPDLLIERATLYIAQKKRDGAHPKFTKDAKTWLNGQNWEDELDQDDTNRIPQPGDPDFNPNDPRTRSTENDWMRLR